MATKRIVLVGAGVALMLAAGFVASRAQDAPPDLLDQQLPVSDPICTFFGPDHNKYVQPQVGASNGVLTQQVAMRLAAPDAVVSAAAAAATIPSAPGGSRTDTAQHPSSNTIDRYIF